MRTRGLVLFLALAACAHGQRSKDPNAWRELTSAHFTLRTDLAEPEARASIGQLEVVRAALLAGSWYGATEPQGRTLVIQVEDESELEEFARLGIAGFAATDAFGERVLVMSAEHGAFEQTVTKHELAHALADHILLRQPRWLSEGLATYLETVRVQDDKAVFGEPGVERLNYLRRFPVSDYDAVLRMGSQMLSLSGEDGYAFENAAWVLVHWLANERRPQLDAYLTRLARAEDPEKAFAAVFPGLTEAEIGRSIRAYVLEGVYTKISVPLPRIDKAAVVRSLAPAEVHATRADLIAIGLAKGDHAKLARAEAEEALRIDPGNPLALKVARRGDANAATRGHPDDWRSWVLLAEQEKAKDPREALEKASALAPLNAQVLAKLAWQVSRTDPKRALELAGRAAHLQPGRSSLLDTYAAILSLTGHCAEAGAIERRAIEVLPDHAPPKAAKQFAARLAGFESACHAVLVVEPQRKSCDGDAPRFEMRGSEGGSVAVDYLVGVDGHVTGLSAPEGSAAMVAAVRTWLFSCTYEPGTRDGAPVPVQMKQEFVFKRAPAAGKAANGPMPPATPRAPVAKPRAATRAPSR